MDSNTFAALALTCAPAVHVDTAHAMVAIESSFNPHAIGLVGGVLKRQPRHPAEAVATARTLDAAGWNYSVGLGQINFSHFKRLGLTVESAFDPCTNLAAMQTVLTECFKRTAPPKGQSVDLQPPLRRALSCYYSGNFITGFQHGYVRKVMAVAQRPTPRTPPHPPKEKT